MERINPRLLEKSVGNYRNRMGQKNLSAEESSIVESYAERLMSRERVESAFLIVAGLAHITNVIFNYNHFN